MASPAPTGSAGGLYAGFGNREKDALAYLSAGIPRERVFIINSASRLVCKAEPPGGSPDPSGDAARTHAAADGSSDTNELAVHAWCSYTGMREALDRIFPALAPDNAVRHSLEKHATLAASYMNFAGSRALW